MQRSWSIQACRARGVERAHQRVLRFTFRLTLPALLAGAMAWSMDAGAITAAPLTGEIQSLTVDDPEDHWSGGSLIVAGQRVILPRNLLLDLPANRLSLAQLFAEARARCVAAGESGLARGDACRQGLGGGMATILANRSDDGNVIAGEVHIDKGIEALSGVVTYINHAQGWLRISGNTGDPNTGTLLRINDPTGRFSIQDGVGCDGGPNCSPDVRFGVDADNYTVTFSTGYPVCLPSSFLGGARTRASDATGDGDPFCPLANRFGRPVADATRFAPLLVGDPVTASGNFELVSGVSFLSVHTLRVGRALTTAPGAPDHVIFEETSWDAPGFQNERVRALFILFTTLADSQLDVFSLHVDPTTGDSHEFPLASTVGNPDTVNQGVLPRGFGIAKVTYDVDFLLGAPVRPDRSPCSHLGAAGFSVCNVGASLGREFAVLSPISREVRARSRNRRQNPRLRVVDIQGQDAPWGEYLTPIGIGHPEFVEIDLDELATPFSFDGIPWNLDRRLSPGGCDGGCEDAPQPLWPFPASGLDPAAQATLPVGGPSRVLGFFPFGAGDVLDWPPEDPPAFPLTELAGPRSFCSLLPVRASGQELPRSELPPSNIASVALADSVAGFVLTTSAATPTAPPTLPLPPTASSDISLALARAVVPLSPGSSENVGLLVFNRGLAVARGNLLTLTVPEGTVSRDNPGWLTTAGEPCNDRAAATPCTYRLPDLAPGGALEVPFQLALAGTVPAGLQFIELVAAATGPDPDPTPAERELVARFTFVLPPPIPEALTGVAAPRADNLQGFIKDEAWAIVLGKLLFWDMQVGSDGVQACASCHFNAGADSRSINQLNPGGPANGGSSFEFGGPNFELSPEDFPFHQLEDPSDNASPVLRSRDEAVSSQGVVRTRFSGVESGVEQGAPIEDPVFNLQGYALRRVEPRNTPSVINAVFNDRNFWDGRAQNSFNGVNPFGDRDPGARVLRRVSAAGEPSAVARVAVSLRNSSLASQAVGPPLSSMEMSGEGRTFADLGKKLLTLDTPLAAQRIALNDSVLGEVSASPARGARISYTELIQRAFQPEWWDAEGVVTRSGGEAAFGRQLAGEALAPHQYTQMMYNFSLFFGLAIQAYESSLVSDDSPFDRYANGDDAALDVEQRRGLALFFDQAKCVNCHSGPVFTNARSARVQPEPIERMILGSGAVASYDNGFYNIGVRPTEEDLGVGGTDPFGLPLSNTELAQLGRFESSTTFPPDEPTATLGAFKTPGLRNVALTAPYFHNGGHATLKQVVEFYNRGGDFEDAPNKDPDIVPLHLDASDVNALVAFLESLTDERVRHRRAPFDHPELIVPNGALTLEGQIVPGRGGGAADDELYIDAVGAEGGPPLPAFLELQ